MNGIIFKLGYGLRFFISVSVAIVSFLVAWMAIENVILIEGINHKGIVIICVLVGIFVPIIIERGIKCPECGYRLLWEYINNPKNTPKGYNPFTSGECPKCNFSNTARKDDN
jgi:hypothetical protein